MKSTIYKRNTIPQSFKRDTKGDTKPATKSIEDETQTVDELDMQRGNLSMERVQIGSDNSNVIQIDSQPKLKLKLTKVENSWPVVDEHKVLPMKVMTSEFNKPHYSNYFGKETTSQKSIGLGNGSVETTKVTGKPLSSHDVPTKPTDFEKNTKVVAFNSSYFSNEMTSQNSIGLANRIMETTKETGKLLSSHDVTPKPTDFEKKTKSVNVEMTASLSVLDTAKSSPLRAHRHKLKGSNHFDHIKDKNISTVNGHERP